MADGDEDGCGTVRVNYGLYTWGGRRRYLWNHTPIPCLALMQPEECILQVSKMYLTSTKATHSQGNILYLSGLP